jgi:D-amino peptidase
MHIYISVDLEGTNGVLHSSQTQPGESQYERALKLMHAEVNAVIEGALKGGATSFVINDSHFDMRNLRIEDLHPRARLISGWQKPFSMVSGAQQGFSDKPFDCAFFIGYHSRAGSACGVLSHTYRSQIFFDVKLNGHSVGETGLNAALLACFNIPVAMVSGDDVYCEQAQQELGKVTAVQVKRAISRYSAEQPSFTGTLNLLKEGAEKSLSNKNNWSLKKPGNPSTLEITMFDPAMADAAELMPGIKRLDGRRIAFEHEDYSVLFRMMLAVGVLGASRKDPYF